MHVVNTLDQEYENRHARIYSDMLALLTRGADPFGHQWAEVVDGMELRYHSRYTVDGRVYQITHKLTLHTEAHPITAAPTS